jgi:phage baseplate assembly protein V
MTWSIAELQRRLENLIAIGSITAVDHEKKCVQLSISGRPPSNWLPFPAEIGRNFRRWRPLRPGIQAVVLSPSGNPAQAVIAQILYSDDLPPPVTAENLDVIQFEDGTTVSYDSDKHCLTLDSVGDIALKAGRTIVIDGKNIVIRTAEGGYYQIDNAGKVTRLTSEGGAEFTSESWSAGSVTIAKPDHGFSPPKVASPEES